MDCAYPHTWPNRRQPNFYCERTARVLNFKKKNEALAHARLKHISTCPTYNVNDNVHVIEAHLLYRRNQDPSQV